ncbi:MAG: 3'-5' exonuclease [Hyphomonadaceae bacterium]|nr:3'-5' exonuclease [Hyphomonadaceae bacterium]
MDLTDAERLLAASADHRILRRIPPVAQWPLPEQTGALRRAIYVDVESTGLNLDVDEVIELALLPFDYDLTSGAITRVLLDEAYNGLRQPSFPIPAESTAIHGISDVDVVGRTIDADRVAALVGGAHVIIAHNAGFDRPMVEKHWPIFEKKNWACSFHDVDWRAEGLSSGKLDYLLMRQGWFYDAHRALGDAQAGVFLLAQPLPVSKRRTLAALLDNARRPMTAVRATGAAFKKSTALKQRGYRWDPGDGERRTKAWWIMTEDADAEIAWLNAEIFPAPRAIPVIAMPSTRRYSSRLWSDGDAGA